MIRPRSLVAFPLIALFACAGCRPDTGRADATPKPPAATTVSTPTAQEIAVKPDEPATGKVTKTDTEWKGLLTPEQYQILRQKGTERAFTGKYWNSKDPGVYVCAGCGAELFRSDDKFDSGCGWPSFDKAMADGRIEEHEDRTVGMVRTEITCARCGGHLGHVFNDGPTATGLRYCVNSASVNHQSKDAPRPADGVKTP